MPKGRTTTPKVGRVISKRADEAEAPARGTETQGAGRKSSTRRLGAEARAATPERTKSEDRLMERVVERSNLWLAYQRVVKNKGAPGVDDLTVADLQRGSLPGNSIRDPVLLVLQYIHSLMAFFSFH